MKCPACNKEFTKQVHNKKFCSLKCRTKSRKPVAGRDIAPSADLVASDVAMRNKFLQMPVRA